MYKDYRFEVYFDYCSGEKEYVVRFFDFPNIIGSGLTMEEALEEAWGNLEFYISYCKDKGREIPKPSTYDDNLYSGKVTFRMSKNLHKILSEKADKEGTSMNSCILEAVSLYLGMSKAADKVVEKSVEKITETAKLCLDNAFEYHFDKNNIDNNLFINNDEQNMVV